MMINETRSSQSSECVIGPTISRISSGKRKSARRRTADKEHGNSTESMEMVKGWVGTTEQKRAKEGRGAPKVFACAVRGV